jgi:hypothetical protein
MDDSSRPDPPAGPHAGAPAWRPAAGWLAVAAGLAAGVLAWWGTSAGSAVPAGPGEAIAASAPPLLPAASGERVRVAATAAAAAPRAGSAPVAPPPAMPRHVVRRRDPDGDQTPDLADYINDGAIPTTAEVIERLHEAGIHEGLGAFSPPGTRPPLVGLAVPEDFALPPGYVRHYQATDDGQRIEPILMFAPDAQLVDADGRPLALPADRVVPPELAPPGLPIRRITVPAPIRGPGRGG